MWWLLSAVLAVCFPLLYFVRWFLEPIFTSFSQLHALYASPTILPQKQNSSSSTSIPLLSSEPQVYISLVAPAYNEEQRLDVMMTETMEYLESRRKSSPSSFTYELLIVDDGSKDETVSVALRWCERYPKNVRIVKLQRNQGKGGAVQQGSLQAAGKRILMLDADGATNIADLQRLESQLDQVERDGFGIAVGSRSHLQDDAVAKRAWYRNILMYGFHFLVSTVGGISNIRDTQCGFKLFTRRSAQALFINQKLRRWCFDVELLFLAQKMKMPVVEVPVNWQEIPGSKVSLLSSSFMMARDMILIRAAYTTGLWNIITLDQAIELVRKRRQNDRQKVE